MAIEKHFIEENVKKLILRKFTQKELCKVGCGEVDIYRTPLGMRISIHAEKPGLVIGRKGKTIQGLTDTFVRDFDLENPQLEVQQIEHPELNATLMAQKIAGALERGIHFRRAVYGTMKRVKSAGALGCEVIVSGKVTGERARMTKFVDGFIKHAGEQKNQYIRHGYAQALLKPGVLGIQVTIVPPDANLAEIVYREQKPAELEPISTEAAEEKPDAKAEGKPEEKTEAKTEEKPEAKAEGKKEGPKKKPARKTTTKKTTEKAPEKTSESSKKEEKKEEVKDGDTEG